MTAKVSSRISHLLRKSPLTGQQLLACEGVSVASDPGPTVTETFRSRSVRERSVVCDKFVGNDRTNEPRTGQIFMDHRAKKRTELHRSVLTPRWGSELEEGWASFYKVPPLRGSIRVKTTQKFVATPNVPRRLDIF